MTNKQAGWSVDNSTDNVTFQSLPDKSMAGRAGLLIRIIGTIFAWSLLSNWK